ncbi:Uma2 family endonuclease [Chamaesiphon sp.]|uniref:Uma2 family endonuclease n=1 Tax=Chamaesiphon sp. TaxID=2814140 RepID=UPI0035931CA9
MNTSVIIDPSARISSWRSASWTEYRERVENLGEQERVFFNFDTIWIDMGNEGINHSRFNELFTLILFVWFSRQTDVKFDLLGGCVMEKPQTQSAAPDKVLYVGGNSPRWQPGEPRRVDLDKWRLPDLVAEIADTTLAIDLDEKKQLYLALGIPEYWVIDVKGRQVLAFRLVDGKYEQCSESVVLAGLPIELLEQTLDRMDNENGNAALWFATQLQNLPTRSIDS